MSVEWTVEMRRDYWDKRGNGPPCPRCGVRLVVQQGVGPYVALCYYCDPYSLADDNMGPMGIKYDLRNLEYYNYTDEERAASDRFFLKMRPRKKLREDED